MKIKTRIARWLFKDEFKAFQDATAKMTAMVGETNTRVRAAERGLADIRVGLDQFRGLSAMDWGFRDEGFLVLAVKTDRGDRVKIFKLRPGISLPEYKAMVQSIMDQYCVRFTHIDAPMDVAHAMEKEIRWDGRF